MNHNNVLGIVKARDTLPEDGIQSAMVGAFGFYYLKMRKPAPKTKGDTNLDEYDYGMDEDEEYAEFDSYDETEDTV